MNIALIAHDKKKDLMVDFCISYSAILKKHKYLCYWDYRCCCCGRYRIAGKVFSSGD